jgi:hypothetical protein
VQLVLRGAADGLSRVPARAPRRCRQSLDGARRRARREVLVGHRHLVRVPTVAHATHRRRDHPIKYHFERHAEHARFEQERRGLGDVTLRDGREELPRRLGRVEQPRRGRGRGDARARRGRGDAQAPLGLEAHHLRDGEAPVAADRAARSELPRVGPALDGRLADEPETRQLSRGQEFCRGEHRERFKRLRDTPGLPASPIVYQKLTDD